MPGFQGQMLLRGHHRLDIQMPQPLHRARRPFDPVRIGNAPPQHLIPAAKPQHPSAPPQMRGKVDVPALRAKGGEVGDCRLAAHHQHKIRVAGQGAAGHDHPQVHAGFGGQRVQIVEVGDTGQAGHRDDHARPPGPRPGRQVHHVLRRQAVRLIEPRDHAHAGPAGARRDVIPACVEEAPVPAELVDGKAPHHRVVARFHHRLRAHDLRDHTAPVDIPHQDHRHLCGTGKPHVGDVTRPQIGLRRAARALHDDQVALTGKPLKRLQNRRHQRRLALSEGRRLLRSGDLPLHDHLRPCGGLRLEQDGVHVRMRRDPGGARLQSLRAPDLAPVLGHGGVVGHVLRLERPHGDPAPDTGADQPGHDHRLADIAAGPLNHDRPGHLYDLAPFRCKLSQIRGRRKGLRQ